jgi:hypothetical protein
VAAASGLTVGGGDDLGSEGQHLGLGRGPVGPDR